MDEDEFVLVDTTELVDYIYTQMMDCEEIELREGIERVLQLETEYLESIGLAVKITDEDAKYARTKSHWKEQHNGPRIKYGCLYCEWTTTTRKQYDGRRCPNCSGPIASIQETAIRTGPPEKEPFRLVLDEPPALVFVQRSAGSALEVYQDGKRLEGVRAVTIRASVDSPTVHEIQFLTGLTKWGDQ